MRGTQTLGDFSHTATKFVTFLVYGAAFIALVALFFIMSAKPALAAPGDIKITAGDELSGSLKEAAVAIACTGGSLTALGTTSVTGTLEATPDVGSSCDDTDSYIAFSVTKIITKDFFKEGQKLALNNRGTFVWFNTPMTVMRSQEIFDLMLKPAIESKHTKKVEFVLRSSQKEFFDAEVWPKIQQTKGKDKVAYPIFTEIKENFGFKMIDSSAREDAWEFHLTFLEEPFTITRKTDAGPGVVHPNILFHVMPKSELGKKLKEVYLRYRLG